MTRWFYTTALLAALAASPALASLGGGGSSSTPEPQPASVPPASSTQASDPDSPRHHAELSYGLGYEEIAKAKKDLAAGKAKNAEKKFRRALERGERAVALDSSYYEAWNLVGYAARKLGDYGKAFSAYERCLAIKPDYAPAIEYLGEAWLERGDVAKAREQLATLEKLGAEDDSKNLRAQIDAYDAAHPTAASTPAASSPAASTPAANASASTTPAAASDSTAAPTKP